jgi:UDP:flavonoid glycosyltransferase YjiC (YdhE family)
VYCEPPEFLRDEERDAFQPIAFFGSLSTQEISGETTSASPFGDDSTRRLHIYVSFGTAAWRYYETEALRALGTLSEVCATMPDTVTVVSLGGYGPTGRTTQLARPHVRVETYVDQWDVLREASVFITHHGLNSTHEAIYHEVPMISYPFFGDQPGLAKRCQELGLAVPLVEVPRGPVSPGDVRAALARVVEEHDVMRVRLAEARGWELKTILARPSVIDRIIGLMR